MLANSMNLSLVFFIILVVRLSSVLFVKTFFVPDEYWQSLEVAHRYIFGYGYLTWEWVEGVRSYLYPMWFAGAYKILSMMGWDTATALIYVPRLMQALLSTYSDWRFFIWSGKKRWSLYLILTSWFWYYICSRTLTNTLETSLVTIALSFFPWHGENTGYIFIAALTCFLRPTAAIIWIPLWIYHLRRSRAPFIRLITLRFLLFGLIVFGAAIIFDSYIRGEFIVTPYQFFKTNVVQNVGAHYGSHPWHWYLMVGFPTSLGVHFIIFLVSLIQTLRKPDVYSSRLILFFTIAFALVSLSFVEHKEFRFVAPLLPIAIYLCGDTMSRWSYKASKINLWAIAIIILISNVLPAWYLGLIHQRAPLEVMLPLQQIAKDYRSENGQRAKILFLMPCHSTPYYSHVHENVTMRFLTCEPNLKGIENYADEAQKFHESPVHWVRSNIPHYPRTAMPTHLVLYEPYTTKITELLRNYKKIIIVRDAELLRNKNIVIYERIKENEENAFNRNNQNQPGEDDIDQNHPMTDDQTRNAFN